ncbi:MAG: hypothetical protein Q7S12_03955 [bacterium]|nr:hypothetical protein [bacterium]
MRYGGGKERVNKELLEAIATAQNLKDRIKLNQTITGETIGGFACLWGCNKFDGEVVSADSHKPWCLWNYYIKCPFCGYENNLAKCNKTPTDMTCTHPCECAKLA